MTTDKTTSQPSITEPSRWNLCSVLVLLLAFTVTVAVSLYQLDDFDAVPFPESSLSWASVSVANHYDRILEVAEEVGDGLLIGPEDLAYDPESGFVYASCRDGWIKRFKPTDVGADGAGVKVEDWVHVGGRPLGIVFGPDNQLLVAEPYKGLLKVTKDGDVQLLTVEADGVKFKLTDGVDVADDGVIYFTDASYKYSFHDFMFAALEGRPSGRFMSFDPSTNKTRVLVSDLYFPNGVAVSPQNDFVIYCETLLRSCSKYYIQGEKKGSVETFVDNLPGYPDNIRYDSEGKQYWIALAMGKVKAWDVVMRYPAVRKMLAMLAKLGWVPQTMKDGGVIAVDLDGHVTSLYTDHGLHSVTVGLKIGNHLYYGSLSRSHVGRFDLTQHAAAAKAT